MHKTKLFFSEECMDSSQNCPNSRISNSVCVVVRGPQILTKKGAHFWEWGFYNNKDRIPHGLDFFNMHKYYTFVYVL